MTLNCLTCTEPRQREMYLEKVKVCPSCGAKAKVLKEEEYGGGMVKYTFQCPKCNIRYSGSWKKEKASRKKS